MTRPRVTVARLMTVVLVLGLGFAALRYNADKNAEIADLRARVKQILRDRIDRPDGYVFDVNHERREVLVNIARGQGARLLMRMSIFDAASPAVPNVMPKGTIELTHVGEQFSTARIIKTNHSSSPILVGDVVYAMGCSPITPERFALLGKLDINRDGKDDRDELKRMIQEAGGVVDFDLPPPDVGHETGRLLPRIDWYVVDMAYQTRDPAKSAEITGQKIEFANRLHAAIKEARRNGTRPMPIDRLLKFLDHDVSPSAVSRSAFSIR